jgi:hypothetical protein
MENFAFPEKAGVQFIGSQPLVSARVAVENKLRILTVGEGDDGHRRARFIIESNSPGFNAFFVQYIDEEVPEWVFAYLADEGARGAQPGGCDGYIRWRSPGLWRIGANLAIRTAGLRRDHVDQELAESYDIHPFASARFKGMSGS